MNFDELFDFQRIHPTLFSLQSVWKLILGFLREYLKTLHYNLEVSGKLTKLWDFESYFYVLFQIANRKNKHFRLFF